MINLLHFTRRLLLYSVQQKIVVLLKLNIVRKTILLHRISSFVCLYNAGTQVFYCVTFGKQERRKLFEDELMFEESSLVC